MLQPGLRNLGMDGAPSCLLEPNFERSSRYSTDLHDAFDCDGLGEIGSNELHRLRHHRILFKDHGSTLALHHVLWWYQKCLLMVSRPGRSCFEGGGDQRSSSVADGCTIESHTRKRWSAQGAQQILVVDPKKSSLFGNGKTDIQAVGNGLYPRSIVTGEQCRTVGEIAKPGSQGR